LDLIERRLFEEIRPPNPIFTLIYISEEKMKRFSLFFVIILAMALGLTACAGSSSKNLVVGTSADYPPYESVDEQGNYVGFDMDLIREIGSRIGQQVEIKDMPFDSLIAAVQEGKVDAVIAAMQKSAARQEKVDFSEGYHTQVDAFLVNGDSTISLTKPQDAAGLKIGVQTGTLQEQWAVDNLVPLGTQEDQIFRYERVDQGALDVKNGRIDVLFINADPAAALAEQEGLKVALVTSDTVAAPQAIAVQKGNTELLTKINEALAAMQQDGTVDQLLKKWNIP
jgi:polar amino acid transport system substrate-binding protein